jgi:alkylated DNA nucleotide flippase Atl1
MASPLDGKALISIGFLAARRDTWSVITYGQLGKRIGQPQRFIGDVLDRVGAWCYAQERRSLALLVINEDGEPSDGMFKKFRGQADPVTRENYERQRAELWQENWSEVELPSDPEEIAAAWERVGPAAV